MYDRTTTRLVEKNITAALILARAAEATRDTGQDPTRTS